MKTTGTRAAKKTAKESYQAADSTLNGLYSQAQYYALTNGRECAEALALEPEIASEKAKRSAAYDLCVSLGVKL